MGTSNRTPYLTATTLNQAFLDDCHDNLVNQLEVIVNVRVPKISIGSTSSGSIGLAIQIQAPDEPWDEGDRIQFTGSPPGPLVTNQIYYVRNPDGSKFNLSLTPTGSLIVKTSGAGSFSTYGPGYLRISDRNKYVGFRFYQARAVIPAIIRTLGDYLSPQLEFASLTIEINNADGALNSFLPAGSQYTGWIGAEVEAKVGLREVASTYTTIFRGKITEEGGFQRGTHSVTITARDDFESVNAQFPTAVLTTGVFPDIEDDKIGNVVPIIYGDWTLNLDPKIGSGVPAFTVNGADDTVNGTVSHVSNVQCLISENDLTFFDSSTVRLKRGEKVYTFDVGDIVNVGVDNRTFEIKQTAGGGTTSIDGDPYEFDTGDEFFCQVKGKDLGSYDNNIIWIARDILKTFGGLTDDDFDPTWAVYRDKVSFTYPQNSISLFKARVWIKDPQGALEYALSLLEQVRLEAFVNRSRMFSLSSLHFDDFIASPAFRLKNWDVERGSFKPGIDYRNNINRMAGLYNFMPSIEGEMNSTPVFRNDSAISQVGRQISKDVLFPNLYESATVEYQLKDILRLTSSFLEQVEVNATWRSLLLDIGGFVSISVDIEGTRYDNVPALIRSTGIDPSGMKVPLKLWSFQMTPFPGYAPGYAGTVGGYAASITQE